MRKELQEILFKKYPDLFQEHTLSPFESCMGRGICCADGWFNLLDGLCGSITNYIKNQTNNFNYQKKIQQKDPTYKLPDWAVEVPEVVFLQIKEKFSNLAINYKGGDARIDGMISFATSLSSRICEECGRFDDTVGKTPKGYLHIVCKSCVTERDITNDWKLLSEWS